jgi:ABC-2 type transport system permease protein
MRTLVAMAVKDLRILVRVRAGLFFTFVWPLVVSIMFGFVFAGSQDSSQTTLRVVAVDEDNTDTSRAFLARLQQSGDFEIERAERAAAEDLVRRGRRSAFVVIKPGFGEASTRMFYGESRRVEVGSDPARAAEAGMIEGLLAKHAMDDVQKLFTDPARSRKMIGDTMATIPTDAATTKEFAPLARFLGELDTFLAAPAPSRGQGAAGWQPLEVVNVPVARVGRSGPTNAFQVTFPQGVLWGIIGCVMTFAVGIVSERVRGTFVRLQVAPLTRAQVLGGKALACFSTIAILQLVLFTMAAFVFDVYPASLPLLALACVSASIGFVGFMMMIASFGRTEQAVAGAGWALLMPMAMLGGAMVPQFVMPQWLLTVGNISPVKWAILALEGAMWRGFSVTEMLMPASILLAFGACCFALGIRGLRDA